MDSFRDIIALWKNPKDLVKDLGRQGLSISDVTVRSWRRRGIPGDYWHALARAAQRRGFEAVDHELLCRLGSKIAESAAPVMEDSGV